MAPGTVANCRPYICARIRRKRTSAPLGKPGQLVCVRCSSWAAWPLCQGWVRIARHHSRTLILCGMATDGHAGGGRADRTWCLLPRRVNKSLPAARGAGGRGAGMGVRGATGAIERCGEQRELSGGKQSLNAVTSNIGRAGWLHTAQLGHYVTRREGQVRQTISAYLAANEVSQETTDDLSSIPNHRESSN